MINYYNSKCEEYVFFVHVYWHFIQGQAQQTNIGVYPAGDQNTLDGELHFDFTDRICVIQNKETTETEHCDSIYWHDWLVD